MAVTSSQAAPPRADGVLVPVPLVRCDRPEYTPEAHLAHLAGLVTLSLTISDDGLPNDVHVVDPLGLGLDESAVACMLQSRYSPAQKSGKPIPLKTTVSLAFLDDSQSDWHLGRAAFLTENGVSRPCFASAKYPGPSGDKHNITVCVRLTIDAKGFPRNLSIANPQDGKLDKQAISIIEGWRFKPATHNGQPVAVPATFNLVHGPVSNLAMGARLPL